MAPTLELDPSDYTAIKNTLARYAVALDTKDFDLFRLVFTEDVEAYYPFSADQKLDRKALSDKISSRTNHALTTHLIEPATPIIEGTTTKQRAMTTTYFTGTHWNDEDREKDYTVWGRYVDTLELVPDVDGGASRWLIVKRNVVFVGRKDSV